MLRQLLKFFFRIVAGALAAILANLSGIQDGGVVIAQLGSLKLGWHALVFFFLLLLARPPQPRLGKPWAVQPSCTGSRVHRALVW